MNEDSQWIVEHFEELVVTYGGLYIAVVYTKVAAIGDDPKDVEDEALKKYPGRKPSVLRVPKGYRTYRKGQKESNSSEIFGSYV